MALLQEHNLGKRVILDCKYSMRMSYRQLRAFGKGLVLLALLLRLVSAGAQTVAGTPSSVSLIELPLRLSLEPLIQAADKTLPYQAGNWRSWKDWHGIKSQYRAWRGPLSVTAMDNVLLVQAHIRYWIRAEKKILGAVKLKGSCGVNEAPRQALIGMQVLLEWGPDWTLRPSFRILPTRFFDRCEMTVAKLDVTSLVEKEFRKQMQASLRDALQTLAPGMRAMQHQAQYSWSLLQEPVALGEDNWLLLRPGSVALSRIAGRDQHLDARLAMSLQPVLLTGPEPDSESLPLPPLGQYLPRSSGLNLHLGVKLDFTALNQRLSDILAGKSFFIQDRETGIKTLNLGGSGQAVSAQMELTGELAGKAELQAKLAYNGQLQRLEVQDLTFRYDAQEETLNLLADAFHEYLREALENAANQALTQHLNLLQERLVAVLRKITPAGMSLDMSTLQLASVHLHIEPEAVMLDGTASGNIRLLLP